MAEIKVLTQGKEGQGYTPVAALSAVLRVSQGCRSYTPSPKGPKIEKFQDLEIFKRDWKFQASHPPNPYFCGEFRRSSLKFSIEIENFKRD